MTELNLNPIYPIYPPEKRLEFLRIQDTLIAIRDVTAIFRGDYTDGRTMISDCYMLRMSSDQTIPIGDDKKGQALYNFFYEQFVTVDFDLEEIDEQG